MLRPATLMLLSLALAPLASADGVAVGPNGLADPLRGEPYYVWIVPGSPEAPHAARPADDCGAGARPALVATARGLAGDIAAWDPMQDFGGGTWFPTCLAGTTDCDASMGTPCFPLRAPVKAYVAYDATTGRYYLELASDAVPGQPAAAAIALTGSTGVGLLMDCVGCPPPGCCDN